MDGKEAIIVAFIFIAELFALIIGISIILTNAINKTRDDILKLEMKYDDTKEKTKEVYDKPKELSEFCIPCKVSCENCKHPIYFESLCEEKGKKIVTRPPQSWMFVEEVK